MLMSVTIEAGTSWTDVAALLISLLTLIVALVALFSWKLEKLYDIDIEALSSTQSTMFMLNNLRMPYVLEGEMDDEIEDRWERKNGDLVKNSATGSALIFYSRLKKHEETYKEAQKIKARLWANYEDNNALLRFYEFALNSVSDAEYAHSKLVFYSKQEEEDSDNDFGESKKVFRRMAYSLQNDAVTENLKLLYENVQSHRAKKPWYMFFGRFYNSN
jgi:hypothetical protein